MAFAISPLSALTASPLAGVAGTGYLPTETPQVSGPDDGGFAVSLTGAIEGLQEAQETSNALAVKAVTGDLDDVHDYTVASSEAKVMLELTAAVRNKAVDAFTEIMRMQA